MRKTKIALVLLFVLLFPLPVVAGDPTSDYVNSLKKLAEAIFSKDPGTLVYLKKGALVSIDLDTVMRVDQYMAENKLEDARRLINIDSNTWYNKKRGAVSAYPDTIKRFLGNNYVTIIANHPDDKRLCIFFTNTTSIEW